MKNEKGFTLIEMLIVLLVISVLLIITIPNMTKNSQNIRDKGCEALTATAEAQAEAYFLDNDAYPTTIDVLKTEGYLKETKCPNGDTLTITDGKVDHAPS